MSIHPFGGIPVVCGHRSIIRKSLRRHLSQRGAVPSRLRPRRVNPVARGGCPLVAASRRVAASGAAGILLLATGLGIRRLQDPAGLGIVRLPEARGGSTRGDVRTLRTLFVDAVDGHRLTGSSEAVSNVARRDDPGRVPALMHQTSASRGATAGAVQPGSVAPSPRCPRPRPGPSLPSARPVRPRYRQADRSR
jgi:hypothetical protein